MKNSNEHWLVQYCDKIIIVILFSTIIYLYSSQKEENLSTPSYTSEIVVDEAKYFRLIYIGSSGCGYSNNEQTSNMIQELKNYFRPFAHNQGYRFLSTGVSVDNLAGKGISFLEKTGSYDQVIAGGSWFNLGVFEYVWGDEFPSYGATPQVLLLLTNYIPIPAGREIGNVKREDKLLIRASGIDEIKELYNITRSSSPNEIISYLKLENY